MVLALSLSFPFLSLFLFLCERRRQQHLVLLPVVSQEQAYDFMEKSPIAPIWFASWLLHFYLIFIYRVKGPKMLYHDQEITLSTQNIVTNYTIPNNTSSSKVLWSGALLGNFYLSPRRRRLQVAPGATKNLGLGFGRWNVKWKLD